MTQVKVFKSVIPVSFILDTPVGCKNVVSQTHLSKNPPTSLVHFQPSTEFTVSVYEV